MGIWTVFAYIRNVQGLRFNHKRVYRIYCELALNLRIKPKRRIKRPVPDVLKQPNHTNDIWSLDFMHDQMSDGQSYRLLNVIEPPRVSRRPNFLREYPNEKYLLT